MRKWLLAFGLLLLFGSANAVENPLGVSGASKQPIQVDADALEVFQEQQKAIFTGNVIAKQGEMTVKSDQMTIYYMGKQDKVPDKKGAAQSIKRIDLDGNVVLTSPGQSARSQKGFYDTQKNLISLTGDVVLTKDNNILKGSKLDYSIDTGYSKLSSEAGATASGGRVRGLFVPGQSGEKQ